MSKQTLALIGGLGLITIMLLLYALNTNQYKTPTPVAQTQLKPTPTPVSQTTLFLSPNPLTISSPSATINVDVDTKENNITAVQFELSYDPKILGSVDITPSPAGTFFQNPVVLIKNIDADLGKVSFALGIPPSEAARKGKGTVATISFSVLGSMSALSGKQTPLTFLPKTLVTAEGASSSVLKESKGALILFAPPVIPTNAFIPTQPPAESAPTQ